MAAAGCARRWTRARDTRSVCHRNRCSSTRHAHGTADGKVERTYGSGRCEVLYSNGTRKEVLPNGVQTVLFANGDIKQTSPDGAVVYFYASAQTTHISQPDGTQLYQFPNGQLERHLTNGYKEIRFADGASKVILPSGEVESVQPALF